MTHRATMNRSGDPRAALRSGVQGRMLTLKIGLILVFAAIACRLVQIQIIDAKKYQEIARKQSEVKVTLGAARGNIYDRNGAVLVSNAVMASLGADPKMMGSDASGFAARLARVFDRPRRYYLEKLASDRRFVYLERRVKPQLARMVGANDFDGVVQLEEPRRLYHYDQLAGQLIGFTDVDNKGLSGIELQCNAVLQGRDGFMIMQRDALGRRRTSVDYPRTEPVNGRHLVLTIDVGYQAIAEEELRKGIERTKAESGLVVMLDPATGEVLAMANAPGANPNDPSHTDAGLMKNRAITDMFEPGSVFKIVTASAALEHRLVAPGQKFYGEQGVYVVNNGGRPRTITDTHPHGMLSMQEAIEQSSNIVMAKISNLIGAEWLYTTARDFGFGTETGIDMPGEVRGELKKPTQWSGTTLNAMAYGYEVGVTPIQIACAYAAVANRGVLMKPFVVKRVLDDQGQMLNETRPQAIRTVVSGETARTLAAFLEGAVRRGTGTGARLDGVSVAGKTGTSKKVVAGRYEPGSYTASFVGFFPSEEPKVVCLVMLDKPREGGYTGGLASAPIFRGIAQKVYATSGRFERQGRGTAAPSMIVPDVTMLAVRAARAILAGQGFAVTVEGTGALAVRQRPESGARAQRGASVTVVAGGGGTAVLAGFSVVPDVHGLSMRRAMNRLASEQLDAEVSGSGVVCAQSPLPGMQVKPGSRIAVRCEPRPVPVITD